MPPVSRGRVVPALVSLLGAGLSAFAWLMYRRDIRRARERISAGSRIVETPCGPVEYAFVGDGPPVLVVHGAGGGFDQGLEIASPLIRSGFRVIAMSRFGYLQTPLPVDASPTAQASVASHAAAASFVTDCPQRDALSPPSSQDPLILEQPVRLRRGRRGD